MNLELTVYELGQVLKKIEKKHGLDLMVKMNLSGGWMTMVGKTSVEKTPALLLGGAGKGNNVIDLRVKFDHKEGSILRLIGAKDKKFKVNIESSKYRELRPSSLTSNEIKINNNECKLMIDEDIIFSIKENANEVLNFIQG